jgi:hypothetical protein
MKRIYGLVLTTLTTLTSLHRIAAYHSSWPTSGLALCTVRMQKRFRAPYLKLQGDREKEVKDEVSDASMEDTSVNQSSLQRKAQSEKLLGYAIDSFLRGVYDRQFADDAASPNPNYSPGVTVEKALRSLRKLDDPEPSHGAAVFLRFCLPLGRGERWGDTSTVGRDSWKEVLRGSLTPSMLARRIRASEFSELLDWQRLDVTEGAYSTEELVGVPSIAFVNAALYFAADGIVPSLIQFTLRKHAGVWFIDTARLSQKELFMAKN